MISRSFNHPVSAMPSSRTGVAHLPQYIHPKTEQKMISIGKKWLMSLTGAACLTIGFVQASQAAVIDTTSSWDGTSAITSFGESNTATYGQTFTVGSDNVLQNFSFQLGGYPSGAAVDFAAYIMA
jgi:hypothetical protein